MRTENHYLLKLVSVVFIFAFTSQANATYASLSDCRAAYAGANPNNSDLNLADAWCKPQMDGVVFCSDQAFLKAIAINSYTQSQSDALKLSFQKQCTTAAANAAGTSTVASSAVPTTADSLAASQAALATSQNQLKQTIAQTTAAQQAAQQQAAASGSGSNSAGLSNVINQATKLAMQAVGGNSKDGSDKSDKSNSGGGSATNVTNNYYSGSPQQQQQGSNNQAPQGNDGKPAGSTPVVAGSTDKPDSTVAPASTTIPPSTGQTQANQTAAQQAASKVSEALPTATDKAQNVAGIQTDPDKVDVAKTQLSTDADTLKQQVDAAIQEVQQLGMQIQDPSKSAPYTLYVNAYQTLDKKGQTFWNTKDQCVQKAEKSNKLCLENKSDGVKAVKALVDYSGPIIGLISSAQKTCGTTGKVMELAAAGMALAKGVCVVAKTTCDTTCGTANKELSEINTGLNNLPTTAAQDQTNGTLDCTARAAAAGPVGGPAIEAACKADSAKKFAAANRITAITKKYFTFETQLTPGTTQAMIKSCQDNGKDILLMLADIGSMAAAASSAKSCEEKLASASGSGAGSNVSTAAYCTDPANSSTQFCKCQGNLTAPGCAGATAASVNPNAAKDVMGTNLKSGSGLSQFAGGDNSGAGTAGNINLDGSGSGTDGTGATLAMSNISGGGGAVTGSSGGGGGGASGSADKNADGTPKATAAADDKKWSFGSFASALSSFASGGKGGGGAGNGNALSAEQQASVSRKIASDRVAAEVTPSSGLDNFSKIKKSYFQRADTFMVNP
ncbi:MAG: hypothetical protein ACXVAX_01630 [Pseudobdellovibrio sp.]